MLKEGVPSINGYSVQPGDIKFRDLDGNGVINNGENTFDNPGDMKVIGNTTSRYQFGANLGVGYKGFDLAIMLQGVGKRDVDLGRHALFPFAGAGSSEGLFNPVYYNQTDYWKAKSYDPESPDYMIPVKENPEIFAIYGQLKNSGSNTRRSTQFLQNGAYLRVKNVTLSYGLPREILDKIHLQQLRVYLSVENLGTLSSLPKGYDPELLAWSYPFYRTWSIGANLTF